MNIQSIRLGVATNSSSSHSILLNPTGDPGPAEDGYGWQDFLLRDKNAKRSYFLSQVYHNLHDIFYAAAEGDYSDKAAVADGQTAEVMYELFGVHPEADDYGGPAGDLGHVDHQSQWGLPRTLDGRGLHFGFLKELEGYYMNRPGLAVAGGNDNNESYDYGGEPDPLFAKMPLETRHLVARKDGDFWTLHNRRSGAKLRLSFVTGDPFVAATRPELVDVKLTTQCPYEDKCGWCYQDSKKVGKHAEGVFAVIDALAELEVFEVAFGGGEPTIHPRFAEILGYAHSRGVVPAFTTFDVAAWGGRPAVSDAVRKYAGGFGVSINAVDQLNKVRRTVEWAAGTSVPNAWAPAYPDKYAGHVSFQAVVGTQPTDFYIRLMKEVKEAAENPPYLELSMVLLGWKAVGRADVVPPHDVDVAALLAFAKKNYVRLGCDTAFVRAYGPLLDEAGVAGLLRVAREGTFSCYVDAVEGLVAKDSYSDMGAAVRVDPTCQASVREAILSSFPFGRPKEPPADTLAGFVKTILATKDDGLAPILAEVYDEAGDDDAAYRLRLPGKWEVTGGHLLWAVRSGAAPWEKARDVVIPLPKAATEA